MIRLDVLFEELLKAAGKTDTERYFLGDGQAPPMTAPAATPASPDQSGESPQGVTAPQSIDPAVSPSSAVSMAPTALIHRALALSRGGGTNV